jgi:hypothetical protein
MGVDAHVPSRPAQTLSFAIGDVLSGLWVTVLLGHPEIDYAKPKINIAIAKFQYRLLDGGSILCPRCADQEVIGLDIAVDEVLVVDRLHPRELRVSDVNQRNPWAERRRRTMALATITTVLMLNFLPHRSNRSSRLGPKRSMTRTLCNPSCPKW